MKSMIPKSRRFIRDEWHPYGWVVSFRQTVETQGQRKRQFFSATGTTRAAAIANALSNP